MIKIGQLSLLRDPNLSGLNYEDPTIQEQVIILVENQELVNMGDDIKNSNKEFKSALHYEVIKFNYEFK